MKNAKKNVKKCEKLILMLAKRVREMPDILVTARGRRQRWRDAEAERGRAGGRRRWGVGKLAINKQS
jgi:hypothetical protein